MRRNRAIFVGCWLVLLSISPITVFQNTPLSDALSSPAVLTNVLQRLFGLWAFTLIFVQIMIGAFMEKLIKYFGGWILKFHLTEGLFTYGLILFHPALFLLGIFLQTGKIDLFILLPRLSPAYEYFLTLGKISFVLVTISVLAAYFRSHPFLARHWRKLHFLNYLIFVLVASHSFNVGSDTKTKPFVFLYPLFYFGVIISVVWRRIYVEVREKITL